MFNSYQDTSVTLSIVHIDYKYVSVLAEIH